jgi:hypothetical protein
MSILVLAPLVPDAVVMETPGARAYSSSLTSSTGALAITSDASMLATTAACAARIWFPAVPVTMTSFSATAWAASTTSTVTMPGVSVNATAAGRKPRRRTSRVSGLVATLSAGIAI